MPVYYVYTNYINVGNGFTLPNPGDGLVVMRDAIVGSTGAFGVGISSQFAANVTVHGTVFSTNGIHIADTSSTSNVHVSGTGQVTGESNTILCTGVLSLVNDGDISSMIGYAVLTPNLTNLDVVNNGLIRGYNGIGPSGTLNLVNTGNIQGEFIAIFSSAGLDRIINSGSISGIVDVGGGDDTIINSGTIVAHTIWLGTCSNSNLYSSTTTGTLVGDIRGDNGVDRITNQGNIIGRLDLGAGADVVTNSGTIDGRFFLEQGNDTYDAAGTVGVVSNEIRGGDGDDTLRGGDRRDFLYGDNDNDVIIGGGGVDVLDGGAGNDEIRFSIEDESVSGGAGFDYAINTYDAFGVTFNLGMLGFEGYRGSAAGETILTTELVAISVLAGGGNDLVQGSNLEDYIHGNDGDDVLQGFGDTDFIFGGNGADSLRGDAGNDTLTGGDGADRFVFNGYDASVDTITDFTIGVDKIEILRSGFLSPALWDAGALAPARFVASANPSPINGTACFLFDNAGPGVGTLYWNDGTGSANGIAVVQFAPGQNPLFFTAADFLLV